MVWRQQGKRMWYGKLPTRTGWKNISLGSHDKPTAHAIQRMLQELHHQRRWELLEGIGGGYTIGQLYDAYWRGTLDALIAQVQDQDLAPKVADWQAAISTTLRAPTAAQYLAQVRTLVPEGRPFMRSGASPEALAKWLYNLPVKSPTMRRYFAAAQSFFKYLVRVNIVAASPLRDLERPRDSKARVAWLQVEDQRRIVEAAYEPYRSFFALLYGTGIEVSVGCGIRRRDVDVRAREVFAPGTKTYCRERSVRVAEWAWPFLEGVMTDKLPDALLFPGMKRNAASWQHRRVTKLLGFSGIQLRDSRHSWAVRAARAGTPAEIIGRQLGHVDATMVLRVYGRFMPSQHDRERWEQIATLQDEAQEAQEMGGSATARATGPGIPALRRAATTRFNDSPGTLKVGLRATPNLRSTSWANREPRIR
jgi:integrase